MIYYIFLILALTAASSAAKFPSNWKKCPKTNNEECFKENLPKIFAELKTGKKDVGIIPIDPLHFDRMEMNHGGNSPVSINLTFFNLDIIGASRLIINRARIDWDKYDIELDIDIINGPGYLIGDYAINGNVLVLPITGKGKSNITLENLSVLVTLNGKEQLKNGKKYFGVEKGGFVIRSERVHLYFGNLFDGVPNLGENMNKFLNENWREIMGELNATISNAVGLGVKQVAKGFFQKFPLTDLYT